MDAALGPGAGKICRLFALLEEHGEAVEADLAFRGVDLRDLWRGDLSWRRLGVLVDHLPAESATNTALREAMTDEQRAAQPEPEGYGAWSTSDLLLAAVVDGLNVLAWQQVQIAGGKAGAAPKPIPRPGVERRRGLTPAQVSYLQGIRESRAEGVASSQSASAP